jgi:hypothetical protein
MKNKQISWKVLKDFGSFKEGNILPYPAFGSNVNGRFNVCGVLTEPEELILQGFIEKVFEEEEIEVILGNKATFNKDGTVNIGCNVNIPSELFSGMLKIQEYCERYTRSRKFIIDENKIILENLGNKYDVTEGVQKIVERLNKNK